MGGRAIPNASMVKFPIFKRSDTWRGQHAKVKAWVGEAAFALIDSLQPVNDPRGWDRSILGFIHDFDIDDKHKLLLPTVSILRDMGVRAETVDGRPTLADVAFLIDFGGLVDGAEVVRVHPRVPEEVVDVHFIPTFQVVFEGQPGPLSVTTALGDAIARVKDVGAMFAKFF